MEVCAAALHSVQNNQHGNMGQILLEEFYLVLQTPQRDKQDPSLRE